jgi:hypothetical protein
VGQEKGNSWTLWCWIQRGHLSPREEWEGNLLSVGNSQRNWQYWKDGREILGSDGRGILGSDGRGILGRDVRMGGNTVSATYGSGDVQEKSSVVGWTVTYHHHWLD